MKTKVDQDTCIGCGLCEGLCADVYVMNENWKAVAKSEPVAPALEALCREAAQQCPVSAISITD